MRNYPTLHVKHRNSAFIAVLHYTVTTVFNYQYKMSVNRPLACSWWSREILFSSINKGYIWTSLSFTCQLVYTFYFPAAELSARKLNTGEIILQICIFQKQSLMTLSQHCKLYILYHHFSYDSVTRNKYLFPVKIECMFMTQHGNIEFYKVFFYIGLEGRLQGKNLKWK